MGHTPTPEARPPDRGVICSARRRLAGYLLDGVILSLTFVVGWYAWSLARYRALRGPGQHFMKMKVVDRRTGAKPRLRQTAVRSAAKWLLLGQIIGIVVLLLDYGDRAARSLEFVPDRYLGTTEVVVAAAVQIGVLLVTTCWLLWNPERQQLWDKLAGTVVVHDRPPASDAAVPSALAASASTPCNGRDRSVVIDRGGIADQRRPGG